MKYFGSVPRFAVAVLLCAAALAQAAPAARPVRFAVIGDRTGGHVPGVYEEILQEVERMRPDFAVTVGDQIEGYTADSAKLDSEWREYKSIVAPLTMPLHLIPGNHDISTDAQLPAYEKYVGKPYYSFDEAGLHFAVLDASRWESSAELHREQIAWLISDLKRSTAKYKFVFYHKPFWENTLVLGKPDTLNTIFRNYGVSAVFNGHIHTYFSEKHDGILYTTVGSSGGGTEPGPTGLEYHFVWVTVDKDGISIAPIKMGSVLPWDEVTAEDIVTIDRNNSQGMAFSRRLSVNEYLDLTDSVATVNLKNGVKSTLLQDTLRWDLPEGWTVTPKTLPVKLAAGESAALSFKVRYRGNGLHPTPLYPAPSMSVRFPYAPGKTSRVEKSLPLVREATCHYGTPVIDGELKEVLWQPQWWTVNRLFGSDGGAMTVEPTKFFFAWDLDNLYFAARCQESKMDSLVARSKERDGPVHNEDCVGYFLQTDLSKAEAYQIYFNPLGTAFDQKITMTEKAGASADKAWNGTYEVKTARGKDFWSIEAKIPLAQFGVKPHAGQQMGLEFRRKQKRLNTASDWQVPLDYNPAAYGVLTLK